MVWQHNQGPVGKNWPERQDTLHRQQNDTPHTQQRLLPIWTSNPQPRRWALFPRRQAPWHGNATYNPSTPQSHSRSRWDFHFHSYVLTIYVFLYWLLEISVFYSLVRRGYIRKVSVQLVPKYFSRDCSNDSISCSKQKKWKKKIWLIEVFRGQTVKSF